MTALALVAFFKDIDKKDLPSVGGKGANLGEMTQARFPVPDGFAITVAAYNLFLNRNNIQGKINAILEKTDVNNPNELQSASKSVQKIITSSEIPHEISSEI